MGERIQGILKLGIAAGVLWALMYHVGPAVIAAIPAFKEYAGKAEEHNIHTGALFYNDVAQTAEGELYIRTSIRFMPGKNFPQNHTASVKAFGNKNY